MISFTRFFVYQMMIIKYHLFIKKDYVNKRQNKLFRRGKEWKKYYKVMIKFPKK